jgi:hypothetical protein
VWKQYSKHSYKGWEFYIVLKMQIILGQTFSISYVYLKNLLRNENNLLSNHNTIVFFGGRQADMSIWVWKFGIKYMKNWNELGINMTEVRKVSFQQTVCLKYLKNYVFANLRFLGELTFHKKESDL